MTNNNKHKDMSNYNIFFKKKRKRKITLFLYLQIHSIMHNTVTDLEFLLNLVINLIYFYTADLKCDM